MIFEQAWAIVKADSGMTSGTPGTNNPRHGPDSPGEPGNFERIKRRSKQKKERRRLEGVRPPGYGKGGILDPNRVKTPPKRVRDEGENPDIDALLEENKRIVGKSASNLLFALGLFRKGTEKMFGPDFFDPMRDAKRQATKGTECEECGMPKRTSTNMMILADGEMCDCGEWKNA